MLGLLLGLLVFIPLVTWLVALHDAPRWAVTILLLCCGGVLHWIAYRLQMHYIAERAPHLIVGNYVHKEASDYIPKWTTQFTGGVIAAGLAILYTWILSVY